MPFISPPHDGRGINHRFDDQYTKLNIWGLDEMGVKRAVYLDADTLVRQNFDELFDSPYDFAAVPDVYEPSDHRGFTISFNAGVIAFRTSTEVLNEMKRKLETAVYPPSEAEQAFLNVFYSASALRLPYAYNANLAIKTRSATMWESLKKEMRIVHFTLVKPFLIDFTPESNHILTFDKQRTVIEEAEGRYGGLYVEEVGWWKDAFEAMVRDHGDQIEGCRGQ